MPARAYPFSMAIHDLAHLSQLSDVQGLCLLVSERTLYVLQNLVALDAVRVDRYSSAMDRDSYTPVQEGDTYYELYQTVCEKLGLEVLEMPTIIDVLEEIRDRLDTTLWVGNHGYFAQDWIANPQIMGYAGYIGAEESNLNASAGMNYLTGAEVQSDEVIVVDHVCAVNITSAGIFTQLAFDYDGSYRIFHQVNQAAAGYWTTWTGQLVLPPGSHLRAYFYNCAEGDDLYMLWGGRRAAYL